MGQLFPLPKKDKELESTRSRLRSLEDELGAKKREMSEMWVVAYSCYSQEETFQARVTALGDEVSSWDTTIAKLRRTVED